MYSLLLNKAVLVKRFYVPPKIKQSHRKGKNGVVRVCLQTLAVIILIITHSTKTNKTKKSRKRLKQTEQTRQYSDRS